MSPVIPPVDGRLPTGTTALALNTAVEGMETAPASVAVHLVFKEG